jgi:hypothetical protein
VATGQEWGDHSSNRPQEYNAVDDKYARVVVDELMPVLDKRYNISKNPDDRAIGGASSGAIAAFTVAWNRPDQFHKVLSTIGSFTNIRGGDAYPGMIRSAGPKPITGLSPRRRERQPRREAKADLAPTTPAGLARPEHRGCWPRSRRRATT